LKLEAEVLLPSAGKKKEEENAAFTVDDGGREIV
jgi:hypothetical protein